MNIQKTKIWMIIIGILVIVVSSIGFRFFLFDYLDCDADIRQLESTNISLQNQLSIEKEKSRVSEDRARAFSQLYFNERDKKFISIAEEKKLNLIVNNEVGINEDYLWHGNKQLTSEKISDLVKNKYGQYSKIDSWGEWLSFKKDLYILYIYLRGGTGWEGNSTIGPYFSVNINTDEVKLLNDENLAEIWGKGVLSLDESKIAFTDAIVPTINKKESIYIYDIYSKTKKKVLDLDIDETVLTCGENGCGINGSALIWRNKAKISIHPFKKDTKGMPKVYELEI